MMRSRCRFRASQDSLPSLRDEAPGLELPSAAPLGGALALDALRPRVQADRALAEIRLIRHVARERGVMTVDRVLDHALARADRLEEPPEMWPHVAIGRPAVTHTLQYVLLSWL